MARALRLSTSSYSRLELGVRRVRALDLWLAARFLGVPIEAFYEISSNADNAAA